jgi:hypothetical protein
MGTRVHAVGRSNSFPRWIGADSDLHAATVTSATKVDRKKNLDDCSIQCLMLRVHREGAKRWSQLRASHLLSNFRAVGNLISRRSEQRVRYTCHSRYDTGDQRYPV